MHLPVKVYKEKNGSWNYERTKHVSTEALFACREKFKSRLVFVGSCSAPGSTSEERKEIEKMLHEVDCIPVFQESLPCFEAYLDFCQTFLWPVMNNQLPLEEDTEILLWSEELWKSYKAANELFCTRVMSLLQDLCGSSTQVINLWVNDFHLFLLPSMLRKKTGRGSGSPLPLNVGIGMFIHTPYPTSEIFLTLPVRSEIMRGLLSADLVGFQFYDYTRHFFSGAQKLFGVRATCQKGGLLALEVSEDRNVFIHITHNCIEHEYVVEEVSSRSVQRRASELRDKYSNRVIMGSVDKLGRTSGILLKLRAFKLFLQQYEQYRDRVVFVLFLMSRGSQKTAPEHVAISEQAKELCWLINEEFGFHVQLKESVDEIDRSALLCVTDVLLETSLKDGLNLVPFEYLAARNAWLKLEGAMAELSDINAPAPLSQLPLDELEDSFEEAASDHFTHNLLDSCRKTGRIVISEFTGSSQVLQSAIRVNPWHMDSILSAIDEALTVPLAIAHAAFVRDSNYVGSQSQVNWAKEFSNQILRARIASINSPDDSSTPVSSLNSAVAKLSNQTVCEAFRQAQIRVLFLDNEGTLAPNLSRIYRHYGSVPLANNSRSVDLQSKGVGPSEDVVKILTRLCDHPNTFVVILSGRTEPALSRWFAPVLSHGIGLAAEHGYHLRLPNQGEWAILSPEAATAGEWIPITENIMNKYVNRTPNTYIEDKGSARVWQFRDAEADFGPAQAKELHAELEISLRAHPVDITTGKGYVEVKLRGVNKGVAVARVLSALREKKIVPDFVLCIGDDRSDESMFEQLLSPPSPDAAVFTSTVGRKRTLAKYFISDVDHVSALLASLTGHRPDPSPDSSPSLTRRSSAEPIF